MNNNSKKRSWMKYLDAHPKVTAAICAGLVVIAIVFVLIFDPVHGILHR